jgi:hypothetical protein
MHARPSGPSASSPAAPDKPALALEFADFFIADRKPPELAPTLTSAQGKRVRMVGFMAHMEQAPSGAFYLTRLPVSCDEMGAGTGDLPVDAVRVNIVPPPKQVPFVPGLIEVTGVLDLGRREEPDGAVSHIRLVLPLPSAPMASIKHDHN